MHCKTRRFICIIQRENFLNIFSKKSKKSIDKKTWPCYNTQDARRGYGGIAQLARAFGSYPTGRRFKSHFRYHFRRRSSWPVGQVVKTPPFHGGNMGPNPVRVTTPNKNELLKSSSSFFRHSQTDCERAAIPKIHKNFLSYTEKR